MAGIDGGAAGTEFVGSHEKAKNGYGQNGYQGASSDLPGHATRMDRDFGLDADPTIPGAVTSKFDEAPGWDTRAVKAEPYAPAHGMKARDSKIDFPSANVRRATKQAAPGTFQR